MFLLIGCRYVSGDRHREALEILHSGACTQLENAQVIRLSLLCYFVAYVRLYLVQDLMQQHDPFQSLT